MDQIEKRQHARVFFSEEDSIQGTLTSSEDKSLQVPVVIMNISSGGLSFIGDRYKLHQFQAGDNLTIKSINTPTPLGIIKSVQVQLKYKLDYQHDMGVFYGCQFMNITEELRKKIDIFVQNKLKNLDDESTRLK
jgi:hypothetical protein